MDKFPSTNIVKIGIVVKDIEKAVKKYAAIFNVPLPEIRYPQERKPVDGGKTPGSL